MAQQHTRSDAARSDAHQTLMATVLEAEQVRQAQLRALWQMTPAQRLAAYHRNELSLQQLRAWEQHAPHEVPATAITGKGELPWILRYTEDFLGEDF